jgi:uncharacterized protein YcfJ
MKRLSASLLAVALAAAAATASAQSYRYGSSDPYVRNTGYVRQVHPDRYGNRNGVIYDYARVVRVDPVIDSSYGPGSAGQRCYERVTVDGYGNDPYNRDGDYGRDGYYGRVGDYDPYSPQGGRYGTESGRMMATVLGGIAGAVLGSKVGGGSGTTAASAVGAMVGSMAGRQIYESAQRNRQPRTGVVRVCDPVPVDRYGRYPAGDGRVVGYDVTYEYAGRTFRTRTDYHPGDRIRVRVDVRPE